MLTERYLASTKNIPALFQKIIEGTAPDKFTIAHLRGIGFSSSNDNAFIPLLKELGFLTDDGTPTQRYHEYRNRAKSKSIMAQSLREAYSELFHINEKPSEADKTEIEGKFKSTHNTSDRVAEQQARTFFALLKLADLDAEPKPQPPSDSESVGTSRSVTDTEPNQIKAPPLNTAQTGFAGLRYNIEVHLPATKDVEVYNAIFKSLREHLLYE